MKRDGPDSKFPVRLLIVYLVCIASLPTLVVMSDFGNFEATEEDWNWVIGWSYILMGPVLAALYLALRNFRHMRALAVFTVLFALFHVSTTIADYGAIPRYIPDVRFGFDDMTGSFDLGIASFLRFSALFFMPFLVLYLAWRFRLWQRTGFFKPA